MPAARPGRCSRPARLVVVAGFDPKVRAYTLRKGDTLDSIARKRDITIKEISGMNPGINVDTAKEGQTILLPATKLSARDKEILEGISSGAGGYRVYPVRGGETLADVISKRGITREEMVSLNPGINLDELRDHQLLKLPANKFTVREREMLVGAGILPQDFFAAAKNPFVIGVGVLLMVCGFVLAWQRFYKDEDMQAEA